MVRGSPHSFGEQAITDQFHLRGVCVCVVCVCVCERERERESECILQNSARMLPPPRSLPQPLLGRVKCLGGRRSFPQWSCCIAVSHATPEPVRGRLCACVSTRATVHMHLVILIFLKQKNFLR